MAHLVLQSNDHRTVLDECDLDLADLGAALLDWSDSTVTGLVAAVQASDLAVVASPTY